MGWDNRGWSLSTVTSAEAGSPNEPTFSCVDIEIPTTASSTCPCPDRSLKYHENSIEQVAKRVLLLPYLPPAEELQNSAAAISNTDTHCRLAKATPTVLGREAIAGPNHKAGHVTFGV